MIDKLKEQWTWLETVLRYNLWKTVGGSSVVGFIVNWLII